MNKKTKKQALTFALQRIKSQGVGYDPNSRKLSPEGELAFAIFSQSVQDALAARALISTSRHRGANSPALFDMARAISYLGEDSIAGLDVIGIDSEWALRELGRLGILPFLERKRCSFTSSSSEPATDTAPSIAAVIT